VYDLFTQKSKKSGFPECVGRGTRGRAFKNKIQLISSPSAWDGALGEEGSKENENSSPSVALGEED
jgi:hypothetical protein